MSVDAEMALRAEKRARSLANIAGMPGLWELFLNVAYEEIRATTLSPKEDEA